MEPEGVAPSSPVCRTGILLLNYDPVSGDNVGLEGVAPPPLECETSILLLNYSPDGQGDLARWKPEGVAPSSLVCKTRALLLSYGPERRREVGRSRTFVAGMSDRHSDC